MEFQASKIMKSGFYWTNPKRKKSSKPFKILFKYNFTIKWQKNAIIMLAMIFHDFPWFSIRLSLDEARKLSGVPFERECPILQGTDAQDAARNQRQTIDLSTSIRKECDIIGNYNKIKEHHRKNIGNYRRIIGNQMKIT